MHRVWVRMMRWNWGLRLGGGLVSSFSTTRQLQRCIIAQILAGGESVEMHS